MNICSSQSFNCRTKRIEFDCLRCPRRYRNEKMFVARSVCLQNPCIKLVVRFWSVVPGLGDDAGLFFFAYQIVRFWILNTNIRCRRCCENRWKRIEFYCLRCPSRCHDEKMFVVHPVCIRTSAVELVKCAGASAPGPGVPFVKQFQLFPRFARCYFIIQFKFRDKSSGIKFPGFID